MRFPSTLFAIISAVLAGAAGASAQTANAVACPAAAATRIPDSAWPAFLHRPPVLSSLAYGSANPYTNSSLTGECTWYAWGRTDEVMNFKLPQRGNALSFESVGTQISAPQANTLAIWDASIPSSSGMSRTGHVAYVEGVSGNIVYFTEANVGMPVQIYDGLKAMALSDFENHRCLTLGISTPSAFLGFYKLPGTPSPVASVAASMPPIAATKPPATPPVAAATVPAPRPVAVAARAPAATTNSASSVGTSTATVAGTVNPGGADTHYAFLYGTNPSLAGAAQTPQYDVGTGTSSLTISANLGGLNANTTYYFQLTASSVAGATRGAVSSFHTAAPPAPKPSAASTTTKAPIATTPAKVKH